MASSGTIFIQRTRFSRAELLYKMCGYALLFQFCHQHIGHAVIDNALAGNGALFHPVERRGIVFHLKMVSNLVTILLQ